MNEQYQIVTKTHQIPPDATPDTIAEMIRALFSTTAIITKIIIKAAESDDANGLLTVDFMVKNQDPHLGDTPKLDPTNIWQALLAIPLEYIKGKNTIRVEAISSITDLLMEVNSKGGSGIGWLVGSLNYFLNWIGAPTSIRKNVKISTFLNLPIIEMEEFPEDALVLLGARSFRTDLLKAEWGVKTDMELKK
jgi:hypothetical protein